MFENSPPFGDYVVYVDESGDHGPARPEFPVFVLAFCIFKKSEYAAHVTTALTNLKFKWFGHDNVVFHEKEIRKQLASFKFLTRKEHRDEFMADLAALIDQAPFTLVVTVLRKEKLSAKLEVYPTAMHWGLERVASFLSEHAQRGTRTPIIFEERGVKEDKELELAFLRMLPMLNARCGGELEIHFSSKKALHCGHQIADMIARPIGLSVFRSDQANRTFEVIERKFRRASNGNHLGYGLKIFP